MATTRAAAAAAAAACLLLLPPLLPDGITGDRIEMAPGSMAAKGLCSCSRAQIICIGLSPHGMPTTTVQPWKSGATCCRRQVLKWW